MLKLLSLFILAQAYPGMDPSSSDAIPAPVVFRHYGNTFGQPLIPDDPATISHVWWNGTALQDTKGNSWTMNGTVPQVTTGPFFWGSTTKDGAGTFSSSNYYSLAAASPLAFADGNPFSICIPFTYNGGGAGDLFGVADASNGYAIGWDGGSLYLLAASGAAFSYTVASGTPTIGPNVVCVGRDSGGTNYIKLNLGSIVSAAHVYTASNTATAKLGYVSGSVDEGAWNGTIYEVWASTDVPSDALFTRIEQAALSQQGSFGEAITNTRSSVATDVVGGNLYVYPAGVTRIDSGGIKTEAAATNIYLNSLTPALQTITVTASTLYIISTTGTGASVVMSGACTGTVTTGSGGVFCTTATTSLVITNGATVPSCVQVELGGQATSCIPTAGSPATRSPDVVTQATVFTPEIARRGSMSFDLQSIQTFDTHNNLLSVGTGSGYIVIEYVNSKFYIEYYNGSADNVAHTSGGLDTHLSALWDVDLGILCITGDIDGTTCSTNSTFGPISNTTVNIGQDASIDDAEGSVIRNICIGRTTSACQ